jgi:retron-type reverse transcriptase
MNAAQLSLVSLELTGHPYWSPHKQLRCLYALSNHSERHYRTFSLPKRSGGMRNIQVPDPLLRQVQRHILRHVLSLLPLSPFATAWRPEYSLRHNVLPHLGKKQVLKLDIENFFPGIIFPQVQQLAFAKTCLPYAATTLLSHLCCYRDRLPQGAPTSPMLANLVMRPFDDYIGDWCQQQEIAYTRYGDDMTFSGDFDARRVKNKVAGFLGEMGMVLNEGKTRLMRRGQQQIVTGIIVNESTPRAPREMRRALRQALYYYGKYGASAVPEGFDEQQWLQSLHGKITFILQIHPEDAVLQHARRILQRQLKAIRSQP